MKNKKSLILKIIGGSTILSVACFITILICVLMLLDFFGAKLTEEKVQANAEYSDAYINALNKYLKNGYVPLQRILYFHLEDNSLTIDTLYAMNQNVESKSAKEINVVCEDQRVKNHVACSESNLKDNEKYLIVSSGHFNFPLANDYTITSFYNQERIIFGEKDIHSGWDFATQAQTPVYSVCDGTVEKVNFTQQENIPYDQSGNEIGNTITLKCDGDYNEIYYVVFAHLYPNSSKVKVGDTVNHWTQVASVGTTGTSTGNHLHYQVYDSNWKLVDGMQLIDLTLTKAPDYNFDNGFNNNLPSNYNHSDALKNQ